MDSVELFQVDASSPLIRTLDANNDLKQETVDTEYGSVIVAHQGADHRHSTKPVLLTYPDLGLNHVTNYQAFFNFPEVKLLLGSFSVLHMNAPGQEDGAPDLPADYSYPTMDQLAAQIEDVCVHYKVKTVIGFGVGLGANVLCRFARLKPERVDGLFLINATAGQSGWTEWFYQVCFSKSVVVKLTWNTWQKINSYYLGGGTNLSGSFPQAAQDYLMWHHFGKLDSERNRDLIQIFQSLFSGKRLSGRNLSLLIESYINRTDLGITRGDKEANFKCPVLLMCGGLAPHVDDTVAFNARLNPQDSTWMKLNESGMVLEEQPHKVSEALRLFIQGLGYSLTAYERRRSSLRKASLDSITLESSENGDGSKVHIVENPIAEANC